MEARLHLPDLIDLTRDAADPASAESVSAINVRPLDPKHAGAFARELRPACPA